MIKNYFNIAWRNITRNKTYAFINILGLSLGICVCIVIFLITHYELITDAFHPGRERIYRIVEVVTDQQGHAEKAASVPIDLSLAAGDRFAGVETIASYVLYPAKIAVQKKYDNNIDGSSLPSTILAGPEYFRIFPYDWLAGNPATALTSPNTVVLVLAKPRPVVDHRAQKILRRLRCLYRRLLTVQTLQSNAIGCYDRWFPAGHYSHHCSGNEGESGSERHGNIIQPAIWKGRKCDTYTRLVAISQANMMTMILVIFEGMALQLGIVMTNFVPIL